MSKKTALISASFDAGVLSIAVAGVDTINLPLKALSSELIERATIHGLTQKISDAAAIAKSELPSDPTEAARVKFEAMNAVAQRLLEGDWSKRSGDGSGPVAGIIYRAFAEFVANAAKDKKRPAPSDAGIRAMYGKRTKSEQLALRNVPEIAAIMERMKAERGTPANAIDATDLLAELGI